MREITVKLYQYDELPTDKAKEKAREWYRGDDGGLDYDWWDSTYSDAVTIAALFGLTIKESSTKRHVMGRNGKPGRDYAEKRTHIFFTGFWSQGDGACFEGEYEYKADAIEAVKGYAPVDTKLHEIVEELQAAQKRADNRVKLSIRHTDRYCHERSMTMEFPDYADREDANGDELPESQWLTDTHRKDVSEALVRFAKWIYRQLESEHDYLTSDEAIVESIQANEYEFHDDGSRAKC